MTTEHRLRIGDRNVLLVEGAAGWGECSPFPGYPCDEMLAREAACEAAEIGWPPRVREEVAVNALIVGDIGEAADLAAFATVKVKVGRGDPAADVERVARVRDRVGPHTRLRVDANGAWDIDTAVAVLDQLARYDLEFAEQPVAALDDLAAVRRRVAVPIAADECVRSVADARRLAATRAADVLVLKVQPLGGVRAALAVADAAEIPAVVSSMMETSIGIAAGLALACALPVLPYACGLATLSELAGDVVTTPLRAVDGWLRLPEVFPPVPARELLDRYSVAS